MIERTVFAIVFAGIYVIVKRNLAGILVED
jgi:hypothetical protein